MKAFRALTTALAGTLATPTLAQVTDIASAAPAMWKVADEDTIIYMFGTFHVVRPGMEWRTPLVEDAIESADELVLEINLNPKEMVAQAPLLQQMATDEEVEPLSARFSADDYAKLEAGIAPLGVPAAALDGFETWFLMIVLGAPVLQNAGFSPTEGIDMTLFQQFVDAGKPVRELEGLVNQVGFLDGADETTQQELVLSLFDDDIAETLDNGLASWAAGDLDALYAEMGLAEMSEAATAAMLADRNPHWADWIVTRLEEPGTLFLAGGAGHFMGDHSVVRMLEHRGVAVERVQ